MKDTGETQVAMRTLPSVSPEKAHDARARAWAYVFDCYAKKEAATSPVGRPDDAERSLSDGARNIIQDTK